MYGKMKTVDMNGFHRISLRVTSQATLPPSSIEVAQAQQFDFVVVNATFETALFDLKTIVHAQRLKSAAQRQNRSAVFQALDLP